MYNQTTLLIVSVVFLSCAIQITRTATIPWSQNIQEDLQVIKRKTKQALHWLVDEPDDSSNRTLTTAGNDEVGMRTFGAIRRLKMAIPAIMFKMGVMTTVLGFLTLFTLKGLMIGAVLLILQLSTALAKFYASKHDHGDDKVPQNIHVHVHSGSTGPGHHYTYDTHADHGPYSGWSKTSAAALSPNKMDDDYYYKRYKEYKDLRDSLYAQVV
ncbi:hypothetical protein CBL_08785 [Carabus blaptoides fortunei]